MESAYLAVVRYVRTQDADAYYSWAIGPENYSISTEVDTTPTKLHTYLTYVFFVPRIAGRAALTARVDLW